MSRGTSAQSRIEEYIRAESRLSSFDKPKPLENETRATYCWRLIRQSVRHAVDVVKKADYRDILIVHGVHHNRKLNHPHPIQCMITNRKTKEYVTLDGHMLRIFKQDGRKKDILTPPAPFSCLVYATQTNLCVGWSPGADKLYLLTEEFEVQSTSTAHGPIQAMIYNENIGEILSIGKGFLTNWVFRYGGRHILPRRTSCEGFNDDDQFDLIALEETASRSQKLFCASGADVAIFNVYDGKLLERRKDLHVRPITAILHFNPLKYLITAAKDGCIKVWDTKWHIQLVFVGHGDEVTSLAIYPYGPNIMSASIDCTLRVWSLETCDQVDQLNVDQPLRCISTTQNDDNFFSFSDTYADLWFVKHVHTLHTRIGHRVQQIKTTEHPEYPLRNVILCRDSSIRIVSPTTGDVLTTLIQPMRRTLVDAAYAVADDILYAVFADGCIIKSATCTNPCTVLDEWQCPDPAKACNYLLVYEYVITSDLGGDTWGGMKRAITVGGIATPNSNHGNKTTVNRTLLLGGRKDGQICVFNRDTGEMEFEIEAHGTKGVLSMVANSKADQLISAGLDNIIKVWRLYPYAQESLAPLMSFFCAHTPIYMSVLRTMLAVAFQEPATATFNVVMYDLRNKDCSYHGPEDDHIDNITGLSVCNKLKLLASCSIDGTVKIWNEVNVLIRVIRLNAVPHSLAFCSEKGDILLGIGEHVHKIDYKHYMPKDYRFKMISMHFRHQKEEKALPFDDNLLDAMSREDTKRLKAARSSFKFTHFVDILTDEENDEVMKEKKLREKAFAELEQRDKLLNKIKDGELLPLKKPKSSPITKTEAFDKYLSFFYDRTTVTLPEDDFTVEDEVKKMFEGEPAKTEPKYMPEKEPTGFFPPSSAAKPIVSTLSPEESNLSLHTPASVIRADGFVPNSVLLRLLWPQDVMEKVALEKQQDDNDTYRPPQMTLEQLNQISSLHQKKHSVWDDDTFEGLSFKDRTLVLDYDDEDSSKKSVVEEESGKSSFIKQMEEMMKKTPTPPLVSPEPVPEPEHKPDIKSQQVTKPDTKRVPSPARTETRKVVIKPKPPPARLPPPAPPVVTKRVSAVAPRQQISVDRRSPSPTPRQATPLPDFITQFKGEDWFEKYFPRCTEYTMPKPWTSQAFAVMLARVLRIADYQEKVPITAAISTLHHEKALKDPEPVTSAIYAIFDHNTSAPNCSDPHQKKFLLKSLELLHDLGVYDKAFYSHLLVQFLDGDKDVRNIVHDILTNVGLLDPNRHLRKELDGWDIWNVDENNRVEELGRMCDDFLEKWLSSFKIHVQDSIDRLKKGQNIHGRVTPTQLKAHPKGILKKGSVGMIGEDEELRTTVTFGKPPDRSAVENATYLEALNYFCEMALEKNLDRIRNGGESLPMSSEGEVKNTVLVFPKISGRSSLVRLGETHTSKCRPHRETSLATNLHFPPITNRGHQPAPGELYGFPSCVKLPMRSIIMDPFGSRDDQYTEQPIMLMLKTAQKYFVHARSYINPGT